MNVSLQQKLVSDEKETRSRKTGKHAKIALFHLSPEAKKFPCFRKTLPALTTFALLLSVRKEGLF
jgi:hypothetical protein